MSGAVPPLPVCVNGVHRDIFTFYSSVITVCAKDVRVRLLKHLHSQRSTSKCSLIIQASNQIVNVTVQFAQYCCVT